MAVEEEQPVGAAGLADRSAQRVAPVTLLRDRLRVAVLDVHPAVRVPVRVPLDVVERAAELIGAALGHGRNLQAARAPELGLIALCQDLHFGDRVDVHGNQLAVVPGVHRRHAVHHDVVLATAAEPEDAARDGGPGLGNRAGNQRGEPGKVAIGDRQVFHRFSRHREGPLAAGCLNHRRLGFDVDGFSEAADAEGQRLHDDAIAWAHEEAGAPQSLESLQRHFHRVGVAGDVREDEVAVVVGVRVRDTSAARIADQRHHRPWNDSALFVLERAADHACRDLGAC